MRLVTSHRVTGSRLTSSQPPHNTFDVENADKYLFRYCVWGVFRHLQHAILPAGPCMLLKWPLSVVALHITSNRSYN